VSIGHSFFVRQVDRWNCLADKVQLKRATSNKGMSSGKHYRTSFCGKLQERDGMVILTGQFQLAKVQRIWLLYALFFLPFCALTLIGQFFGPTPALGFVSLFPVALLIGFLGMTAYDKLHSSSHDIAWLTKTIQNALSNSSGVKNQQ
jgi:hypothetical protein